ncbi:N-acyl-D-amino-acid deacylase family protein [Flavisphingomonas formosensis]|uniref:N-acyl-D-amino-acid deacylase family protein n=1 Tax=Flavisphingomonas formosensis TaxID=861534 RepID=UPI0012F8211C|nr:amidohydrolase family protein [Sphingomonas formosensis]
MANMLIKGGTVIDGTGAPAFAADVRVRDGAIVEIGAALSPDGDALFDAAGCYVSPGFIESHTHYDATMWWQPDLDPLPGYGATTIVTGNCGFSAAPLSDEEAARMEMIKIFAFFEDIPLGPFLQNVPWDWRSWPEYRRSVEANIKLPTNYGMFVGHLAIRLAAMGLDAWTRVATPAEIEAMARMLDDALSAGALGLSDNLHDHDGDNRPVPTLIADDAEFEALLAVLEKHAPATYQVIVDTSMRQTGPEMLERLARLTKGRKLRMQIAGAIPTLEYQRPFVDRMDGTVNRMRAEGYDVWPGYAHVPPTVTASLYKSLLFAQSNDYVWHEVVCAEGEEAKEQILRDPEWRARARDSWDNKAWKHSPFGNPAILILTNPDKGDGPVDISVKDHADSLGIHPSDALADWFLKNGTMSTVDMVPMAKDEDLTVRLMLEEKTVGNISDAGAHLQMLCGGGENVMLLTKYARDDKRISLEHAVHMQTGKLSHFFGLADRGEIKVGKRADIAVWNLDEIEVRKREKRYDVPDGKGGITWRFTREAAPMRLTLVNGVPTFENGAYTGAKPGEFLAPEMEKALYSEAAE